MLEDPSLYLMIQSLLDIRELSEVFQMSREEQVTVALSLFRHRSKVYNERRKPYLKSVMKFVEEITPPEKREEKEALSKEISERAWGLVKEILADDKAFEKLINGEKIEIKGSHGGTWLINSCGRIEHKSRLFSDKGRITGSGEYPRPDVIATVISMIREDEIGFLKKFKCGRLRVGRSRRWNYGNYRPDQEI